MSKEKLPVTAYEGHVTRAQQCGAKVTQHEIGFTHAEFEAFLKGCAPTTKKQAKQAKRIKRLEGIVIGAGFLLQKAYAASRRDLGEGMRQQIHQCLADCNQIGREVATRDEATGGAS